MPEPRSHRILRFADGLLVVLLLALTFLLGCFRQIDMDIWWHLKTGQEILRRGEVPTTDWYTFTSSDRPWIDLHWLFQIAAAKLYAIGGMRLLTATSAALGTAAVGILLLARRPSWSVALHVAALVPSVFLLTGRMYVRPEVVTLVCMASFLTILFYADRRPWLLWLLLPIQILWVNVQGLFVLGLVLSELYLIEGVWLYVTKRPGANLLRRALLGIGLNAACLFNPYGLTGLFFPLELFMKISTDAAFYSQHIAELQSLPQFIASAGVWHFYLLLHLALIGLGAASFVLQWTSKRFDLFRLLTFIAFTWLSLQATRNSGQFALAAGAIIAWNCLDRNGGTQVVD